MGRKITPRARGARFQRACTNGTLKTCPTIFHGATTVNLSNLITDALRRENFWLAPNLRLEWQPPTREDIPWEIFRGRLLEPTHTRQTRRFISWSIYQINGSERSAEPLLAVKLDEQTGDIYIVRAILCHVWAGVDSGSNVIESRERTRWVRELVGTLTPGAFEDSEQITAELAYLVGAAIKGTSRLPVHSVEAPLPAYSFGQLAYLPQGQDEAPRALPMASWQELAGALLASLEALLRAITPGQAPEAARLCASSPWAVHLPKLLCEMFNNVSLSPYTDFVPTTLAFVQALASLGMFTAAKEIDLWSWLLRQLSRHLTAYDLVTFHYRGANYPDALLLDALLRRYVSLIEQNPLLFSEDDPHARLRRGALRQACLLRRHYEDLPVPDAPTSPGENARVLPAPFARVPEEQLLHVMRRQKHLYDGEPLEGILSPVARTVLAESLADLANAAQWRELGTAVFVERPLGWDKQVGEPDLTPLLAHVAYSPSIARRCFGELRKLADSLQLNARFGHDSLEHQSAPVAAVPARALALPPRPILALADTLRVADDFVILRTLPRGLREVFGSLDFGPIRAKAGFPEVEKRMVVARVPGEGSEAVLAMYDATYRKRLEMTVDASQGFSCRGGVEMPVAGLRVARVWDERAVEMRSAGFAALIPRLGGSGL